MAKAPTNDVLSHGLSERLIPLEVRPIVDLKTRKPKAAIARIGAMDSCDGETLFRFAERQGRGRELLMYKLERAARSLRLWRSRGFTGPLYVPLRAANLPDRTLATSFDVIAKSQNLEPSAFSVIVPLTDYFAKLAEATSTLTRLKRAGCGVALAIDNPERIKFRPVAEHPFTAFMLGGESSWHHLRTAGPGRLGALGSWVGWSEASGLERIAAEISEPAAEEAAKLYGFVSAEGPHFADYVPARDFIPEPPPKIEPPVQPLLPLALPQVSRA